MVYFISDVHLGFFERKIDIKREDLLLELLKRISLNGEQLFILGDLFDFWFEYKTVIPREHYRLLNLLYELRKQGIAIEYLMGNHDFGHKNFFETELDIRIHKCDIERVIYGKKFYLSHGDGKTKYDAPYRFIKRIMWNPISIKLYSMLHPNTAFGMALSTSKKSREHTNKKDYGEVEGMEEFASKRIDEGFDYVVMGHRHKVIQKKIDNGYYINLGEWLKNPTFGIFDGDEFQLHKVEEFLNK